LELGIYALGSLGQEQSPGWNAIYVAVISIFLKEMLFWLTMWTGKKEQNRLLQTNQWHHISNALFSMAALIGLFLFSSFGGIGYICADYKKLLGTRISRA